MDYRFIQRSPIMIEDDYSMYLQQVITYWKNWLDKELKQGIQVQYDAYDSVEAAYFAQEMAKTFEASLEHMEYEVEVLGQRIVDFNAKEWERITSNYFGIPLSAFHPEMGTIVKAWNEKNVSLIRNLSRDTQQGVMNILERGYTTGASYASIRDRILRETNLETMFDGSKSSILRQARNRAELIALDQVGKFNALLTEMNQTSIGVKTYIWHNAGDDRVRGNPTGRYPDAYPSHWHREGKTFSWDNPPEDGHPGVPIRCRCIAEANFKELLE